RCSLECCCLRGRGRRSRFLVCIFLSASLRPCLFSRYSATGNFICIHTGCRKPLVSRSDSPWCMKFFKRFSDATPHYVSLQELFSVGCCLFWLVSALRCSSSARRLDLPVSGLLF